MSADHLSRHRAMSMRSIDSKRSLPLRQYPPTAASTPDSPDNGLAPCTATATFFLYAQRNQILVLHHDTLAIERRFDLHREDIAWIISSNVGDKSDGRLVASFDIGKTAIVWDVFTGVEVARFSAYEHMRAANFMRNGNIVFGNDQGNLILFEPATSEHNSARTIFDPITAIAPAPDQENFAIGYLNGTVLIVTLKNSFTILHTLNSKRTPSCITGLAWHASSSKAKTDMLACQTSDGDLKVWSVPKGNAGDAPAPTPIRDLRRGESQLAGPCWFAWSKNGRIIQYADGETRSWDVRTKKVTSEVIPTVDGIVGIANYGPRAKLFIRGRNHTVYEYDIDPANTPMQVANVQHVPANTPPTPPGMLDERKGLRDVASTEGQQLPQFGYTDTESSADEGGSLSPRRKMARQLGSLDALDSELDEMRDQIMPLSPTISARSSVSSRSSGRSHHAGPKYRYDQPSSSRASSNSGYEGTEFSFGADPNRGHDAMSIRSVSSLNSYARSTRKSASRRDSRDSQRTSSYESRDSGPMQLFPFTVARLKEVPFRTPHYGDTARTPELLTREMFSVVFGWEGDAHDLLRDELSRHRPGSSNCVILAKWLGEMGGDDLSSLVGSHTMTSSDWMLLALSSIGAGSQKKVGEAFVQRLLENNDIHPAVAILIGLGEFNDAIEVYVSQLYWMEAVLLTCLAFASDWQRISFLIRKWGEAAMRAQEPELAVRCFSCTSVETSEPWFSPRAKDAVYAAQQERLMQPMGPALMQSPASPPSRNGSTRMTAKNASLKLITTFGEQGVPLPLADGDVTAKAITAIGATPIAQSALSPGAVGPWRRAQQEYAAQTATPGGYVRKKRLPSRSDIERAKQEAHELMTPLASARNRTTSKSGRHSSASSQHSLASMESAVYDPARKSRNDDGHLPSPSKGAFEKLRAPPRKRSNPDGLAVEIIDTTYADNYTPSLRTNESDYTARSGAISPAPTTGNSVRQGRSRVVGDYGHPGEESHSVIRAERSQSRRRAESSKRNASRSGRVTSRARDQSETRSKGGARVIRPAKRSPSSPVPMSPEEIKKASMSRASAPPVNIIQALNKKEKDEDYYKVASPTVSHKSLQSLKSEPPMHRRKKSEEKAMLISSLAPLKLGDDLRGRTENRKIEPSTRSPSLTLPLLSSKKYGDEEMGDAAGEESGSRLRARSTSRQPSDELQARRLASRDRSARSSSRRPAGIDRATPSPDIINADGTYRSAEDRARSLSRKETAARELAARRQSLARRPSVPAIPLPADFISRPQLSGRSYTDVDDGPTSLNSVLSRSQTVDPDAMSKYNNSGKASGTQAATTTVGLPATPRAMRLPRYMNPEQPDHPVPEIPDKFNDLASVGMGSSISQLSSDLSSLEQDPDDLHLNLSPSMLDEVDDSVGPLLPATVFGQKPVAPPPPPPRSASAPPEKLNAPSKSQWSSGSRVRNIMPPEAEEPDAQLSIDAALRHEDDVIVIPELPRAVLPELQHLANSTAPPPPPPPPVPMQLPSSGPSNDGMYDNEHHSPYDIQPFSLPQPTERPATTGPSSHRRNVPSGDSLGSRFRGIGDRMRSSSRSRSKHSNDSRATPYEHAYDQFPPQFSRQYPESLHRAKSPYEQAMAAEELAASQNSLPSAHQNYGIDSRLNETSIPPLHLPTRSQSSTGYRHPKEVRANMPPGHMQFGAYQNGGFL